MDHRKSNHPTNCWYVHPESIKLGTSEQILPQDTHQKITCVVCKEEFIDKQAMMNHRKSTHPSPMLCRDWA